MITKLDRNRITFIEKISSMDPSTIKNYKIGLDNFENFCLEKQGKADCIPEFL